MLNKVPPALIKALIVHEEENYYSHDDLFNKPYSELSTTDAAMLIPFLEAPSKYNLLVNPELAQQRQGQLLKRMAGNP
ncbi:MAG: transglycosylase domain-containing protein [Exilibacterium sp.]